MAKLITNKYRSNKRTKRPGVHSKNASKNQVKFKKNIEDKENKIFLYIYVNLQNLIKMDVVWIRY